MRDFSAYLKRIGCDSHPSMAEMHQAHTTTIPFENFDPLCGIPNSLALDAIEDKLVTRKRGGYCFEHNLLFAAALEEIGVEQVQPILARVRVANGTGLRPRSHLLLKVSHEGRTWHADVGFGSGGLLTPIPYGPGEIYEQSGWHYRIVPEGSELVLQMQEGDDFHDLYAFVDEPAVAIDIETSNWYVCTHPRSPFTSALYCSFQEPGRRWILSTRSGAPMLITTTPTSLEERPVDHAEVPLLLEKIFHLPGVSETPEGWTIT